MGVLECITDGDNIHETVAMRNQHKRMVSGITPLFLAAQRGHSKVCKLLVENGANPNQPSFIQGTTELCTPAEVARLNLHFLLSMYLSKAVSRRKQEDAVLEEDENGPRTSRGPPNQAEVFMMNLGDLSNWDPASGAPQKLDSKKMKSLMKKNKIDLLAWRPDNDLARSSQRSTQSRSGFVSSSRVVTDMTELQQVECEDHSKVLHKFLKDLDLDAWNPDEMAGGPPAPSVRSGAASPRSQGTPTRSRAGRSGAPSDIDLEEAQYEVSKSRLVRPEDEI